MRLSFHKIFTKIYFPRGEGGFYIISDAIYNMYLNLILFWDTCTRAYFILLRGYRASWSKGKERRNPNDTEREREKGRGT